MAGTPITVKTVNLATGRTEQTIDRRGLCGGGDLGHHRAVAGVHLHLFFTAVVVLCVAFITSSITSLRLTNPLKEIAETARKFGHGSTRCGCRAEAEGRGGQAGRGPSTPQRKLHSARAGPPQRVVANISHDSRPP
ncbi:MAG: hypothetical protein ACLRWQ_24345 [Flavonifractor plautii]